MTMKPWRATCIQMSSKQATKAETPAVARKIIGENIAKAIELIEAALVSPEPPRLVVLPEFGLQGPPHNLTVAAWMEKAVTTIPGWITEPLQTLAVKHRIYIAGNQFEGPPEFPGRYFNSCFLIDPKGDIILRFRRINTAAWPSPHDVMNDYIKTVGKDGVFPVVDTELGRIGMIACGEIAVPEVARMLMMQGAEIILHPTNEDNSPAQEAAKIARAAENMCYLVSANVADGIGFSADGSVKGGHSRIVDYRGRILSYRETYDESVAVTAEIDIEALRDARRDRGMANTLLRGRWDMYRDFYNGFRVYPANAFLEKPMKDMSETAPAVDAALGRLAALGISRPARSEV